MGRVIAIDYGKKRTGIAVTDPLKITVNPLQAVPTSELHDFLKDYVAKEDVECIVVGMPKRLSGEDSHITRDVVKFIQFLKGAFPGIEIAEEDEQFTSKMAVSAMIEGGMKKKDRRKKENIDKISAAIILRSYLDRQRPPLF